MTVGNPPQTLTWLAGKSPFLIGDTEHLQIVGFFHCHVIFRGIIVSPIIIEPANDHWRNRYHLVRIVKTTTGQKRPGPFVYSQCLSLSFLNIFEYQPQTIIKKNPYPQFQTMMQSWKEINIREIWPSLKLTAKAPSNRWYIPFGTGGKLFRQRKTPEN